VKLWRVQLAHGMEISLPSVHRQEGPAKEEVAHILQSFLLPNARRSAKFNQELGQQEEWVADVAAYNAEIQRLLAEGDVWAAYDKWHELEERHNNTWTYPIWVKLGTVIVETREFPGPTRRIPIMKRTEEPPITMYDPGEGAVFGESEFFEEPGVADAFKKLRQPPPEQAGPPGPEMGAEFRRWRIQYADFGGSWHPSVHVHEEPLLSELTAWLWIIIQHMGTQLHTMTFVHPRGRHEHFADMTEAMKLITEHLQKSEVWEAYRVLKEFEGQVSSDLGEFPLWMSIGTVIVEGPGA
jgi:hypothetical protein